MRFSHIRREKKENAGTFFMRIQNTSCMNGYRRDRHGILTHIGRRGTNIPARIRDNPCFELFGIYSKRLKMGVVSNSCGDICSPSPDMR